MADSSWEAENLEARQGTPDWFEQGQVHAHVRFVRSADALSHRSDHHPLVSQIDFNTDRLLYIASVGPNANCDRIEIDHVTITDDEISIDCHVDRAAGMAAQVITYPASLLRVPNTAVDHVTATITDGWQQSHTVSTTF